jgi:RimJ/RimL family protein N-acetyltransferase
VRQIITQPKELIGKFVALVQGRDEPWGNFTTIGLVEDDALIAGVVYNNFGGAQVCAHIGAIKGSRWASRAYLHAIFAYPFDQLQKRRITALVAKKNRDARLFVEGLGFILEGKVRQALADDDLLLYGIVRSEAGRWLGARTSKQTAHA